MLPHFSYEELQCPLIKKVNLAYGFGDKLEKLRVEFGYPMRVNSCCRSEKYNKTIGGAKHSFHISDGLRGCCAVDISTYNIDRLTRERLIFIASKQGWSVGLGKNFLHLDRRVDYTVMDNVVFGY